MRRQLCPLLNLSFGLFRSTFMEYLCANSRWSPVCTLHLLVGAIHQSNARAEPIWIACGRRSSHLFAVKKSLPSPRLQKYDHDCEWITAFRWLWSQCEFMCVHVPVFVCWGAELTCLIILRADFQSHSVRLESLSGVTFSMTPKLQAAHLKLCAAASYHVMLNGMEREEHLMLAVAGSVNLSNLCGKTTRLQKTSLYWLNLFKLFNILNQLKLILFVLIQEFIHSYSTFNFVSESKNEFGYVWKNAVTFGLLHRKTKAAVRFGGRSYSLFFTVCYWPACVTWLAASGCLQGERKREMIISLEWCSNYLADLAATPERQPTAKSTPLVAAACSSDDLCCRPTVRRWRSRSCNFLFGYTWLFVYGLLFFFQSPISLFSWGELIGPVIFSPPVKCSYLWWNLIKVGSACDLLDWSRRLMRTRWELDENSWELDESLKNARYYLEMKEKNEHRRVGAEWVVFYTETHSLAVFESHPADETRVKSHLLLHW